MKVTAPLDYHDLCCRELGHSSCLALVRLFQIMQTQNELPERPINNEMMSLSGLGASRQLTKICFETSQCSIASDTHATAKHLLSAKSGKRDPERARCHQQVSDSELFMINKSVIHSFKLVIAKSQQMFLWISHVNKYVTILFAFIVFHWP